MSDSPHAPPPVTPSAVPSAASPRARELLARAEGEAQAALALLFDVAAPEADAREHLRAGFAALARLARVRAAEPDLADDEDLHDATEELRAHAPGWLGARAEAASRAVSSRPSEPTGQTRAGDTRAVLTIHARGLIDAVRAAEAEIFGAELRRAELRAWGRRLGMVILALVPAIVLLAVFPPDYREGPWRAEYFDNHKLEGEPVVRRDGDLRFKWESSSPLYDIAEDSFSARWDTCMVLDEPHEIAFQLVSDDGSRLFVDGDLVVDNWGTHSERARGGKVALEPGLHHLRVEYFEAKHNAAVSLAASLRGERPESVPARLLRYPGDEIDEDDPCAAVRADLP